MDVQPKSRAVKPNGDMIKRLRIEKGWRVEDLANKAKCSLKTVENVEKGANVYLVTLATFATALGVEYPTLVSGGQPPPEPPKPDRCIQVQIVVSIPFDDFDQSEQLGSFVTLLKRLIGSGGDINVVGVRPGSTIITLEMGEEDARTLAAACLAGEWDELPYEEIRLPSDLTYGTVILLGDSTTGDTSESLQGGTIIRLTPSKPSVPPPFIKPVDSEPAAPGQTEPSKPKKSKKQES